MKYSKLCANQRGFTLLELVITTLVVGVIAYVVAIALSAGMKAYFTTDFRGEALDQANFAMERMTREIRNLRDSSSVILVPPSTTAQLKFSDADENTVEYSYSAVNKTITRTLNATPANTLSTNITSFSFGYIQTNGNVFSTFDPVTTKRIRISITATVGTEKVTIQSEVWPRIL
jgi:prepilin-type N-terminal cleavage/methylation domain-containing protein